MINQEQRKLMEESKNKIKEEVNKQNEAHEPQEQVTKLNHEEIISKIKNENKTIDENVPR